MWRLIGITPVQTKDAIEEIRQITQWLEEERFDFFHIRKPIFDREQTKQYLSLFRPDIRKRLALHDHYELAEDFGIGGINITEQNRGYDVGLWNGRISYSCHSIESVAIFKSKANYVFLSPVFNSLSKCGYKSSFTLEQLQKAKQQNIIDNKVIALGGVTESKFDMLNSLGFGGAAMLGALWRG